MNATERNGIKTLGLLSGGLDSTIAVKLMLRLGYDVTVLNFMSPFCNCTKKHNGCKSAAHQLAGELGIEIKAVFMGEEYIDMLRAPKHGYGKGINPCLDCRIMMFQQAKKAMEEIGAKFIFTGEVLSQRPMSQMRNRLHQIENESGLKGLVVRPLSAALLEPTTPEKLGWIDRNEMLSISGRSRKPQIEIGREMGMEEESFCSSGGCLLTDGHFAGRMRDLLSHTEKTSVAQTRLLRVGRHFRVSDNCKVIVGRNEQENEKLEKMAAEGDFFVRVMAFKGPMVLISGSEHGPTAGDGSKNAAELAAGIAVRYSDAPKDEDVEVEVITPGSAANSRLFSRAISESQIAGMRV